MPAPQFQIAGSAFAISKALKLQSDVKVFAPTVKAFEDDFRSDIARSGQPVQIVRDNKLPDEAYRLEFGKNLVVRASTPTGLAHGLTTLIQLRGSTVHLRTIVDKPKVQYRAVMIDVARRYYPIPVLKTLVRWCELGKVRYLQLHLTDDQNWMFPTKVLPGVDIHNGSGHRAYLASELTDLQSFALARGVTVIPEIDMPGHCALATAVDSAALQIRGSQGTNCLNFASPHVRSLCKALICEVTAEFPSSPFIHLGGDEAWYPGAELDPEFQKAKSVLGPDSGPDQVFADFLGEMTEEAIRRGKTPLLWEGFARSPYASKRISKRTVLVAWDGASYPARQLVPDGWSVVNAGWDPNYVVNHYPYDVYTLAPLQRLYLSDYRTFGTVDPGPSPATTFQFQDPSKLKGSMLCWWEGHPWNALEIMPERIAAFGARLWNPSSENDFGSFQYRFTKSAHEFERASRPFTLKILGTSPENPTEFANSAEVRMSTGDKTLTFGIGTGGEVPAAPDRKLENSVRVTETSILAIQSFRGQLPIGEPQFCRLQKVHPVANLALHAHVTSTAPFDPQFPPERVTSGSSDDLSAYWLAYPNPQTLTVDLGSTRQISRIEVVACWANNSPARYRLLTSNEGKGFTEIVDASKQTEPATKNGYVHRFSPLFARFVRIQTLGSDLYPPSMMRINQIRVFDDPVAADGAGAEMSRSQVR